MLKAEMIQYAQDFTEHKADDRLDIAQTLELRLSKFMKEKEFWWRRKVCKFTTVPERALYSLKLFTPAILNVEKIRRMQRVISPGKTCKINPIWDEDTVMAAQESASFGVPTGYTMEPGATNVIRLMPTPDAAYTVKFAYLGTYQQDESIDQITDYIPEDVHFAVQDGLIADLMMFLYGPEDSKYTTAAAAYAASVAMCYLPVDFTSERIDTFVSETSHYDHAVSSSA